MSYITLDQSDLYLSYNATWLGLSDDVKKNHLITAALWLNYSYEWPGQIASCPVRETYGSPGYPYTYPFLLTGQQVLEATKALWPRLACDGSTLLDSEGCPITGIPHEVMAAQAMAAEQGLTYDLFVEPTSDTGKLTSKRIKAGPVEIERVWESSPRGKTGELIMTRVDAILYTIAPRRGTKTGRIPVLF